MFKLNVIKLFLLVTVLTHKMFCQSNISVFKNNQLKNSRVKDAYDTKWTLLKSELKGANIKHNEFDIYLRAFKHDAVLEVWMKNKSDAKYKLFKTYAICATSGILGPKRKEGDGQVPEGFYQIDLFNPKSDYYLSMRINYPNASDVLLKEAPNAGSAIMIHGECVTIGCLPMTNDKIKEIYVLCVEAKNRNNPIYIDVFPAKFTKENMDMLTKNYPKSKINFWKTLKAGYDYFEENHWLPRVNVDKKGNYFYAE